MFAMSSRRSTTVRKRPRVAAIGLSESQLDEIRPHCGDLRPATDVDQYLQRFSWTETDIVVASGFDYAEFDPGIHLLTIGPMSHGDHQPIGIDLPLRYRELVRMELPQSGAGVGGRGAMPADLPRSG